MDPLPSCFRCSVRRADSSSRATPSPRGPALITTVYETQHGLAALTWSRTMLGLSLRADLRLPSCASFTANDASSSAEASACYSFRVRPWLLWKRRGTRRFRIKDPANQGHQKAVDFAWDLSRVAFPLGGGPQPSSVFFVAISVDGEMLLSVGDMHETAYKKIKSNRDPEDDRLVMGSPQNPILLARREHVVVQDRGSGRLQSQSPSPSSPPSSSCTYSTTAHVGGREREIAVDLGGKGEKDLRLRVLVDGRRVLQVRRLRWKFRGGELVDIEGCDAKVHVSWDVHSWLFQADPKDPPSSYSSSAAGHLGHGVIILRFSREGHFQTRKKPICITSGRRSTFAGNGDGTWWGLAGFGPLGNSDRSTSSSIGGSGKWVRNSGMLAKTRSSSSSSSASSGSSSSVTEWASAEEHELRESEGFSLVVSFWKH